MFCTNVSSYRYKCSKFIIAPIIHDRGSDMIGGEKEKELCVILTIFLLCSQFMFMLSYLKCLGLYSCFFCKFLGFVSMFLQAFMVCTMLCSLYVLLPILLAKCYAFSSSILSLVPLQDFVPRCIYFMYCALVECWACK